MNRNIIETVMGAVVLVVAGFFMMVAYKSADFTQTKGYQLIGRFEQTSDLKVGADVRVGGVKVGSVSGTALDTKTYMAVVHMTIDPDIQLPADTIAKIASEGLLGGRYVSLIPGGEEDKLKPGDEFQHVQSAVDLESLIGQAIFSTQGNKGSDKPPVKAPLP